MSNVISRNDVAKLQEWVKKGGGNVEEEKSPSNPLLTANQLEEIQQQAHKEGYQVGYNEGLAKGQNEIQQKVSRLEQVFQALQNPLDQLDDTVEEELVTLSLAIAKQIIRRELKIEPEHVIGAIREAIGTLPLSSRNIQVMLHPEDGQVVRNNLSVNENEEGWKIVDDPTVSRGGCRIVTDTSTVDATLETRLAAVAAQVLGGERARDDAGE